MIQSSPEFYHTMATLYGAVGVIMLFSAYWSFQAENIGRLFISLFFATGAGLLARACYRRAQTLKKEKATLPLEPTDEK